MTKLDLIEFLIEERTNFLLYQDSVEPEVGWWLWFSEARNQAIVALKKEKKIPPEYKD